MTSQKKLNRTINRQNLFMSMHPQKRLSAAFAVSRIFQEASMTLASAESVKQNRMPTVLVVHVTESQRMTKVEKATTWLEERAADPKTGYSQASRWGPDYDCSSFIITAWEQAGVPVKSRGATYTGNMVPVFLACGFKDVTASVNLATGEGLHRGDVIINEANHAVQYVGNGKIVHARSSEGNNIPGDQSGNEVRVQPFWNYPFDRVLRYPEVIDDDEPAEDGDQEVIHPMHRRTYFHLEYGDGIKTKENPKAKLSPQVRAWQALLLCWGYDLGKYGADGEFGTLTMLATQKWQEKAKGIGADVEVNGIVDEDDWIEIINVEA
jgi:hypothetical protein